MILVVNVCREKLHYYEFVRPIEDVLRKGGFEFETFHYDELDESVLARADKVIVCGTSLKDNFFLENLEKFYWLKNLKCPVLGICAGFQILGRVFGCEVLSGDVEIGFFREEFVEEFLGLKGEVEVYHLHSNHVNFGEGWRIFAGEGFAQTVLKGNFYGVLFHPEVRNKEMILEFARL